MNLEKKVPKIFFHDKLHSHKEEPLTLICNDDKCENYWTAVCMRCLLDNKNPHKNHHCILLSSFFEKIEQCFKFNSLEKGKKWNEILENFNDLMKTGEKIEFFGKEIQTSLFHLKEKCLKKEADLFSLKENEKIESICKGLYEAKDLSEQELNAILKDLRNRCLIWGEFHEKTTKKIEILEQDCELNFTARLKTLYTHFNNSLLTLKNVLNDFSQCEDDLFQSAISKWRGNIDATNQKIHSISSRQKQDIQRDVMDHMTKCDFHECKNLGKIMKEFPNKKFKSERIALPEDSEDEFMDHSQLVFQEAIVYEIKRKNESYSFPEKGLCSTGNELVDECKNVDYFLLEYTQF